jgi:hypothetical protein
LAATAPPMPPLAPITRMLFCLLSMMLLLIGVFRWEENAFRADK